MLPPELFFAACLWIGHPGVPAYAETIKDSGNVKAPLSGLTDLLLWGHELHSDTYLDHVGANNSLSYVAAYNNYRAEYGHYPGLKILTHRFGHVQNFSSAEYLIEKRLDFIGTHIEILKLKIQLGSVHTESAEAAISLWESSSEFWRHIKQALSYQYQHPNRVLGQRHHLYLAMLQLGDEKAFHNLQWPNLWDWYEPE